MLAWRRASSTTPTSDWLMTAVGPPPWATRILPVVMERPWVSVKEAPIVTIWMLQRQGSGCQTVEVECVVACWR